MIKSRKEHQYQIVQFILTPENNPSLWTDKYLNERLNGEIVIGFLFKREEAKFGLSVDKLNLYTIDPQYNTGETYDATRLRTAFIQFCMDVVEHPRNIIFRNPPIKNWLDTKENWIMKITGELSQTYNREFNEVWSVVNKAILQAFEKPHVYVGNLGYIRKAALNEVLMLHRYEQSRMLDSHKNAISLDTEISVDDGQIIAFHELIGRLDPTVKTMDFECMKQDIIDDLSLDFSPREIDMIINMPLFLSMNIYRRLNKWRKTHKRGDYNG